MNVFSLKRKAESQQAEINDAVRRQNDLEYRFVSQMTSMNSTQSLTQHFYPSADAATLPEQVDSEESGPDVGAGGYFDEESLEDRSSTALASLQLIREWEHIDIRVNPRRELYYQVLSARDRENVENFRQRHRYTLETIRLVRNSIAHGRHVSDNDINGALEAAKRLNSILDSFGIAPF